MILSDRQDLGIFEKFRAPITSALNDVDVTSRHRIDRFLILDLDTDPKFPYSGNYKKIYFAVKVVFQEFVVYVAQSEERGRQSQREVEVLAALRGVPGILHPQLIREEDNLVWFITELANQGDLLTYIDNPSYHVDSRESLWIAYCVAKVLWEFHERKMILRDFKPDNVLIHRQVDGTLRVELTDFGFTYWGGADSDAEAVKSRGTLLHIPPEDSQAIRSHDRVLPADEGRDLWALGALLYSLQTKNMIVDGIPNEKKEIVGVKFRLDRLAVHLGRLDGAIRELLSLHRPSRPSAWRIANQIESMIERPITVLEIADESREEESSLCRRFWSALTCCLQR
jgi:serine/threonine protein kinase